MNKCNTHAQIDFSLTALKEFHICTRQHDHGKLHPPCHHEPLLLLQLRPGKHTDVYPADEDRIADRGVDLERLRQHDVDDNKHHGLCRCGNERAHDPAQLSLPGFEPQLY